MHIVVCKAVGEPARPGRALDAVFGHIHPAVHPIQIGPAAKHHCGRGQGAGAAPALFEVEPNINVQVHGQCPGEQHGHQGHRCKQGSESFPKFASKVLGCFHVSILSSQKSVSFTGVKYIILLLFCKHFCSHFLNIYTLWSQFKGRLHNRAVKWLVICYKSPEKFFIVLSAFLPNCRFLFQRNYGIICPEVEFSGAFIYESNHRHPQHQR